MFLEKQHDRSGYCLRVVDNLEAFTLPERQIGGRPGFVIIQRHKGRDTSCKKNTFSMAHTGGVGFKPTLERPSHLRG